MAGRSGCAAEGTGNGRSYLVPRIGSGRGAVALTALAASDFSGKLATADLEWT